MANENLTLMRKYRLGVRVVGGSTYTTVSGVLTSWSKDTGTAKISIPENNGFEYDLPTTQTATVMFEGPQLFTSSGQSTRDAGQLLLFTAAAPLGNSSLIEFQITHDDLAAGSHSLTGAGYVTLEGATGGNGDVAPFKGQIALNGPAVATGGHFTKQLGSTT